MGVERGVATRRAQMVWPMMTVTMTNFEGFTGSNFKKPANICEFRLQMVWPMMTVTVTNFEGFTRQQF